ncbi:AAA family ATPase [Pseudonocardia alni]|uniref:AAA family ATPase n=1 Tax=Pseudonocardia alni TaxID=33907 RepID=UPI0027A278A2|nr:AAA family ATPase [Pseudonocardia alni]
MTKYYLRELRIEGFRGINNEGDPFKVKFDLDKVNSVFASNGTGKSSIFEAIQYCITGQVSKLGELDASEKPNEHLANLFHSKSEASIELRLAPSDGSRDVRIQVVRSSTGLRSVKSSTGHPDPEGLLRSLAGEFTLLDYGTFEEFIRSSALARGRTFAPLLGLSRYSTLRRALQTVADSRNLNSGLGAAQLRESLAEIDRQKADTFVKIGDLSEVLTGVRPTDTSAISEVGARIVSALQQVELLRPSLTPVPLLSEIKIDELRSVISEAEGGSAKSLLNELTTRQVRLEGVAASATTVDASRREVVDAVSALQSATARTRGPQTKRMFDCAHSVLGSGEWDEGEQCPLCGSELEFEIGQKVADVLEEYRASSEASELVSRLLTEGSWFRRIQALENEEVISTAGSSVAAELKSAAANLTITVFAIDEAQQRLEEYEDQLSERLNATRNEVTELGSSIPESLVQLTVQVDRALAAKNAILHYEGLESRSERESSQLKKLDGWTSFIKDLSREFGKREQDLASNVMAGIESDYREIFAEVVSLGDVVPVMDRDGGESLGLGLEQFHGLKNISARAVLSESARNAFAISVYLAAAKLRSDSAGFVVLDDVTSSFDAGNQLKLMEVIRTKLQKTADRDGFQFILLSHDVLLEKYFDRLANESDWRHCKLTGFPPLAPLSAANQDADRLRQQAEFSLRLGSWRSLRVSCVNTSSSR